MKFEEALVARTRAPEIPESEDVYGWLIGRWELDVRYLVVSQDHRMRGEVLFSWVLEGRAVQDLWIAPPIADRRGAISGVNTFGTTLRVWDPSIRAWRVTWINPPTGRRNELIGRKIGNEIVQVGTHPDGTPIRWKFVDIARDSFRWTGESLQPDGETWTLEAEFFGRRKE
ncbi:MAG TPA: hypothetical protein VGE86_05395 [Thermoanaerobaculia bacterium]